MLRWKGEARGVAGLVSEGLLVRDLETGKMFVPQSKKSIAHVFPAKGGNVANPKETWRSVSTSQRAPSVASLRKEITPPTTI
jgi:hypothetical protein